jgi:hypothetical protein
MRSGAVSTAPAPVTNNDTDRPGTSSVSVVTLCSVTGFGRFVQLLMTRAGLSPKDVMRGAALALTTLDRLMTARTVTSTATIRTLARGLSEPAEDLLVMLRPYTPTDPAHIRARFDLMVGDLTMDEMRDAVEASPVLSDERKKLLLDDIDTIDWEHWIR